MLTRRPVNEEIAERFPATLELTLWGFIIAVVIGIFWGSEASRNREKAIDMIKKALDAVGIESDRMNEYPFQFSGGMRQRTR